MTVLPVIKRELRAEARRPFNHWLRVMGAAAALVVCAMLIWEPNVPPAKLGAKLFAILHTTIFVTIWVMVPVLTADCLSREKREGTLGLLFLTPLTARSIVVGKSLVHALRSMTLWLSTVPILAIPVLLGGVSWLDVFTAFTLELCAVLLALAAGLLASSSAKRWTRALLLAEINSIFFASIFGGLFAFVCWLNFTLRGGFAWVLEVALLLSTGVNWSNFFEFGWSNLFFARMPGGNGTQTWLQVLVQTFALSVLLFTLVCLLAARRVEKSWREEPRSARMLWWEQVFCTPILWLKFFRRMMRRKLEKNPIGWLEQRTWSGRLVTWSWFAVMISLYSAVMSNPGFYLRGFDALQNFMAWLLVGSMAFTAAGSFRRERETGVLELLLVSPVSVGQIIGGRLRGLWGQFLPALVVLLGIWLYFADIFNANARSGAWSVVYFGVTFVTLPVMGLYFSLRCSNFISAFLWTLLVGVGLPDFLPRLIYQYLLQNIPGLSLRPYDLYLGKFYVHWYPTIGLQILFAAYFWNRLQRNLTRRAFALERAMT